MRLQTWLYFGCLRRPGHALFLPGMRSFSASRTSGLYGLNSFDGMLAPQDDRRPYRAALSRLPGWGLSALAFWDHSVDPRPGSNSIVFAPDTTISADAMLSGFRRVFPVAYDRLPGLEVLG
ncbi:MAG: hypothetical protein ABF876_05375 [Acetobacter aceti]